MNRIRSMSEDELKEEVITLKMELQRLKDQYEYTLSVITSEKGTLQRQGIRLREEIKIVEDRLQKTLYNGEGIVIQLDRLKQEAINRKAYSTHIRALWVIVIGGVILELIRVFVVKP